MTKHILSLTIALTGVLTLTPAFAEDAKPAAGPGGPGRGGPGGPGERRAPPSPEERLKHMKETLSLTDDQATKILPILQKGQETMKSIREDASVKDEDKRAKSMEARKASMEEVAAILTPEQKEKLKAERGPGGPGGRGPGGPGGRGPKPDAAK